VGSTILFVASTIFSAGEMIISGAKTTVEDDR
jgi:hypothetical protein